MGPDGKPVPLTVTVDATTAAALEECRAKYQAEVDAKTGDAPYLDFNHDDGPASAWVKEIYWAGDDPQTGGIRAKVSWTDAGREAIEGRLYRRFSPSFIPDESTGRIIGAPVNMGGLVNRAAFRRIQALFATQPPTIPQPPQKPTMTPEEIAALQAENETLKKQLADLQSQLDARAKKDAQTAVDCAAAEGRIPAAPEVKAKWVSTLLATPESATLLASLAPNPALKATIPATTPAAPVNLLDQYNALPRAERPAFYAKHREALNALK